MQHALTIFYFLAVQYVGVALVRGFQCAQQLRQDVGNPPAPVSLISVCYITFNVSIAPKSHPRFHLGFEVSRGREPSNGYFLRSSLMNYESAVHT